MLDDNWAGAKTTGQGGTDGSTSDVHAKLLSALRQLKPRKIVAAFEMHGSYAARTGRVELVAGTWIGKSPDGWITVATALHSSCC